MPFLDLYLDISDNSDNYIYIHHRNLHPKHTFYLHTHYNKVMFVCTSNNIGRCNIIVQRDHYILSVFVYIQTNKRYHFVFGNFFVQFYMFCGFQIYLLSRRMLSVIGKIAASLVIFLIKGITKGVTEGITKGVTEGTA